MPWHVPRNHNGPMKIRATLTPEDFESFLQSLLPLRVALGDEDEPWKRVGSIDSFKVIEIVKDHGAKVTAPVRIEWPHRSVMSEFTIKELELMFEFRLRETENGMGLAVSMRCDGLELSWIPDFVDRSIAKSVDNKLRELDLLFVWDFCDTLTFNIDEESQRTNLASIEFSVVAGALVVDDAAIELAVPMSLTSSHVA